MSKSLTKKRSVLLVQGLDISKPSEYLDDTASPSNQNFRIDRSILTKRNGTTLVGSIMGYTEAEP
jgi:hypothetical protein